MHKKTNNSIRNSKNQLMRKTFVFCKEKIYGIKVVVTGDAIRRHEKTMVIMNHRTRLDWLYFSFVVFHFKIMNRQKIALKSDIKWIPGLGNLIYFA